MKITILCPWKEFCPWFFLQSQILTFTKKIHFFLSLLKHLRSYLTLNIVGHQEQNTKNIKSHWSKTAMLTYSVWATWVTWWSLITLSYDHNMITLSIDLMLCHKNGDKHSICNRGDDKRAAIKLKNPSFQWSSSSASLIFKRKNVRRDNHPLMHCVMLIIITMHIRSS